MFAKALDQTGLGLTDLVKPNDGIGSLRKGLLKTSVLCGGNADIAIALDHQNLPTLIGAQLPSGAIVDQHDVVHIGGDLFHETPKCLNIWVEAHHHDGHGLDELTHAA